MSTALALNASLSVEGETLRKAVEAVGTVCRNSKDPSQETCIFLDCADDLLVVSAGNRFEKVWAEAYIPCSLWYSREQDMFHQIAVHKADLLKGLRTKADRRILTRCKDGLAVEGYQMEYNARRNATRTSLQLITIQPYTRDDIPTPASGSATWERTDLIPHLSIALRFIRPDAYRRALTGVLFDHEYIVASDGVQLVRRKTAADIGRQFIIPRLAAEVICKLYSPTETIKMTVDEHIAVFEAPSGKVMCQLFKEQYPDWRRVFPRNAKGICRVSAKGLLEKLTILATGEKQPDDDVVTDWIKLTGSGRVLSMAYHSRPHSKTPYWTGTQKAVIHGSLETAIRTHYLKNILACFERPIVKYYKKDAPLEITEGDTTCLVMPIMQ